ncbi:MAG: hypothetical protein PGN30_13375 [Mycolicibacterium neoaurum]|uniref:hypothetical protein n=1 Tax=Mycolicibacterium neoaurum TaxID=1795 RepID=UPI002FF843AD
MDVLNPSPALCLPQAMWLTYRTIMSNSDLSEEEVLALVTPNAMRASTPGLGAHAIRALRGLREFGLVQQDSDELYNAETVEGAPEFIRRLRRQLVVPSETLENGAQGAPDLRQGLVWLMRQSPAIPLNWEYVQAHNSVRLFTNDTRWNAFADWPKALGLGRSALTAMATGLGLRETGVKIVPNPTEAVVDAIRHPFGERLPVGEEIPVQQLLAFLRDELPVLPGHPSAVYDGIGNDPDNGLRALGLALSSAEERKVLSLSYQSDPSGVMALPDAQDHGRDRYVSAVRILG